MFSQYLGSMEQEMKKIAIKIDITLIPAEAIGPLPLKKTLALKNWLADWNMNLTVLFVPPVDEKETQRKCICWPYCCSSAAASRHC